MMQKYIDTQTTLVKNGLTQAFLSEVRRHIHQESYMEYLNFHGINLDTVLSSKSVGEYNLNYTLKIAGFSSVEDYNRHISSDTCLQNIKIPS